MANYHLELKLICRGKGQSLTRQANYITGRPLYDLYLDKLYNTPRPDVLSVDILLPKDAPTALLDLEQLCHAVDRAERRWDARTARSLIGSLPNELSLPEWRQMVESFIRRNFLDRGLCAVAAIHHGKHPRDPRLDNPHVHIIVPIRAVGPDGFLEKKDRSLNRRDCLLQWRTDWALVQNQAYERRGLAVRVSHEKLETQGITDREPTVHIHHWDWKREQRSERTTVGNCQQEIRRRGERKQEKTREQCRTWSRSP